MWRMSTGWCRSTSSPVWRRRSRNWRKFSCISGLGASGAATKQQGGCAVNGGATCATSPARGERERRRRASGPLQSAPGRINETPEREESAVTKTMKALVLRRHGDLQDLEVVTDYPVP